MPLGPAWLVTPGGPPQKGTVALLAAWLHDIGYAPDLAKTGFTRSTVPAVSRASMPQSAS